MAMIPVLIRFFRDNAAYFGIRGRMLTLGHQQVLLSAQQFNELFGASPSEVSDRTLFSALGAQSLESLDYFGTPDADITCDLNMPFTDPQYNGCYDCVFDSGTGEHIFNIANGLSTIVRLVKNAGTVIHVNPCLGYLNHGFYSFQPTLFFDFYGDNGFSDMRAWLFEFTQQDYYQYPGYANVIPVNSTTLASFKSANNTLLIFTAKKKQKLDRIVFPLQSVYRRA